MLKVLFTSDYEIHGNGDGCPDALMVEPTQRMLQQFDNYGAKLTIMADVAEILKFKEYADDHGRDDYRYQAIADQLRDAIRRGHDVQLHIHASYFNAQHQDGRWLQDWSEYNFAGLSYERLCQVIGRGKAFLESLLQPVNSAYRCFVFRAANWSMSPSRNIVRALVENGIQIDTSVFKYGRRQGLVNFDYRDAVSNLIPWIADENNICASSPTGKLVEFPIYSENRRLGAFITRQRIHRALVSRAHRFSVSNEGLAGNGALARSSKPGLGRLVRALTAKHAWKADFNQCTGRQLARALERAERDSADHAADVPFVLIGHSKLFTRLNERSLAPFLEFVSERPDRFGFASFADFNLEAHEVAGGPSGHNPTGADLS